MQVDRVKMEISKAGAKEKMSGLQPPPHALLSEGCECIT